VSRRFKALCAVIIFCAGTKAIAGEERNFNIRLSPLGLLVGVLTVDGDYGIGQSTTIGPTVSLFNRSYNGATYSGGALGVRANFYLGHDRFTNSWIVAPYLELLGLKVNEAPYNAVQLNGSLLGAAIAYQWVWPSGFNLDAGGNVGTYSLGNSFNLNDGNGNSVTVSSPYTGGFIGLELTIGYAF
jgi:hypothetical protein